MKTIAGSLNHENHASAFGAPGIEPRWTSSEKDGIGTAYHTASRLWFTISHGIINEVYFPHVDIPNIRDLQFLITDGESFCHEEKRDLHHVTECPEKGVPLYRITSTDKEGRYSIVKEVLSDPHAAVLLVNTRLKVHDDQLRSKLKLYALLAPHLKGSGWNNSAHCCPVGGRQLIEAWREDVTLSFGCKPDFLRRSVGYVGSSDLWQDLMANYQMNWEFDHAMNGNIAIAGEIDLSQGMEFTLAVAFGDSSHSACSHLVQSIAVPFASHRQRYIEQWRRVDSQIDLSHCTTDEGRLFQISHGLLLTHEDKTFQGAFVASLSIPWGHTKNDTEQGGYHLVWTRDMVQTATALLACGHVDSPFRALTWLSCVQAEDGSLPQNSSIRGEAYWTGIQLDEIAAPILLAWRLRKVDALQQFDPWPLVSRAARYLLLNGPVTAQERWEEASGYSPSTLACMIAGLVCAADFAKDREDEETRLLLLSYADWLSAHIEQWTVTNHGELLADQPRHYIRITPAEPDNEIAAPDPDNSLLTIANGGGTHLARNIVGGDFLHLVRFGVRAHDDPVIQSSLLVIDHVIKRDLPQGAGWRRYNWDGYGQYFDGRAFDGEGEGRCWPLLTGERGHYEVAAGRDATPFIRSMEAFANEAGMLPEQVWDTHDLPDGTMTSGAPTGAAMPLCWAHAEYMSLARSQKDGVCFDRIDPVYERYVESDLCCNYEMWNLRHQISRIESGRNLRIITGEKSIIHLTYDGWNTIEDVESSLSGIGCWVVDLPTASLEAGRSIHFTILWQDQWEGRDFTIEVINS